MIDYQSLIRATHIPTSDFSTRWALTWAANVVQFEQTAEEIITSNIRPIVYDAQDQFEKHLENVMYRRPHQPEF